MGISFINRNFTIGKFSLQEKSLTKRTDGRTDGQRDRTDEQAAKQRTKTHKSSSWLYGGAKRLLGQTAAAINLNSHAETQRLAFHTGWDIAGRLFRSSLLSLLSLSRRSRHFGVLATSQRTAMTAVNSRSGVAHPVSPFWIDIFALSWRINRGSII